MSTGSDFENPYASPGEVVQASTLPAPQLPRSMRAFFWFHVALTASPFVWVIVTLPAVNGSLRMRGFELFAALSLFSIPVMTCVALWFGLKYGGQIGWRGAVFGILEFMLITVQWFIAVPLFQ